MAKSEDEDDNENQEVNFFDVQKNLKSYSQKKLISLTNVLIDTNHSLINEKKVLNEKIQGLEQVGDDTVVNIVDLKELVEDLTRDNALLISQMNKWVNTPLKQVASKTHFELEIELKKAKMNLSAELEKNKQLQEVLRHMKIELDKSLHWTCSSEKIAAMCKGNDGLSYNLLSVSQICDKGNRVEFLSHLCTITNLKTGEVVLTVKRYKNIYAVDFGSSDDGDLICLSAVDDNAELSHRRLGHASFTLLNKLVAKDLVGGLPNVKFKDHKVCDAYIKRKKVKTSFKPKKEVSTFRPLELLHMDLCGPMRIQSRGGKKYIFVIVDNFSRFTWTLFLRTKDETFPMFVAFVKQIQVKLGHQVVSIRSDYSIEFDNANFNEFCTENKISHNFSAPRTPQSLLEKTPYELLNEKKHKLTYLKEIGCKCFTLNNGKEALGKFDAKKLGSKGTQSGEAEDGDLLIPDEVLEITNRKAEMMNQVEERNEEDAQNIQMMPRVADAVLSTPGAEQISGDHGSVDANDGSNVEAPGPSSTKIQVSKWKHKISHPLDNVITPLDSGIQTRSKVRNMFAYSAFISQIEPKNIKEELEDAD
ncbi:uncharacterized protein LOC132639516 [Lycium barbarum]|uniref:uncharacterized protein LOC132639516 n=1 Tax=Lycium barbarum TaxID=112863 RepID=UPI00293F2ABA|nr:uncharacterized protein LOC132639516 [Lycium barbarum]